MKRINVLLAVFLVLAIAGPAGAQTEGAVLDAHAELDPAEGNESTVSINSRDKVIQTFVAKNTGVITDLEVLTRIHWSVANDTLFTAQIVELPSPLEGNPEVLAETSSSVPSAAAGQWETTLFTFDAPAHVVSGQTYGLTLQANSPQTAGRLATSSWQSKDVYPSGQLMGLLDGTWYTNMFFGADLVFAAYVIPDSVVPATKERCKDFGYEGFGFRNQGQCIKAVNHAE